MKSLTAVRKKSPNYPVEFKIKMVERKRRLSTVWQILIFLRG
ncbi:hypothetical protein [Klebsiella pneumoniae]|nr:hypothetical protein [Klebsiella pneumoniae]MDW5625673.1 hypothetical protein [Klebsiella pneumoniae]MDW5819864.1 hypothetical protein [Klebsiella pneumoniae]